MAISVAIKRELWMSCGGYCQNVNCNTSLLPIIANKKINIDEFAHIIPQSNDGPRNNESDSGIEIDSAENIIMLCPTCHTLIDKQPNEFPRSLLSSFKKSHQDKIKNLFIVAEHKSRQSLLLEVEKFLRRNKAIFNEYGPFSESINDPLSDSAAMWRKLALQDIVPNNKFILNLLDKNAHLLNSDELEILEQYRLHIEGFEYNQVSRDLNASAPTFPIKILHILRD